MTTPRTSPLRLGAPAGVRPAAGSGTCSGPAQAHLRRPGPGRPARRSPIDRSRSTSRAASATLRWQRRGQPLRQPVEQRLGILGGAPVGPVRERQDELRRGDDVVLAQRRTAVPIAKNSVGVTAPAVPQREQLHADDALGVQGLGFACIRLIASSRAS